MPGLAFALKAGQSIADETHQSLEQRGFTTIVYNKKTVYLKPAGTKDDYMWIDQNVPNLIETADVPSRHLNLVQFRSFLVFRNITAHICRTMHFFVPGRIITDYDKYAVDSQVNGYKHVKDYAEDPDSLTDVPNDFTFATTESHTSLSSDISQGSWFKKVARIFRITPWSLENKSPVAFVHGPDITAQTASSFISAGQTDRIVAPGLLFKFAPKLALPDPQVPGDVIGRYFLSCLGVTVDEQFENLNDIKSALSGIRLTELSDAYSHLYKCIELAVQGNCGCVPIFTSDFYEGCVLMGGSGSTYNIVTETVSFIGRDELRQDFLSSSDHNLALQAIAASIPNRRLDILAVTSMFGLREICVSAQVTPDAMSSIITHARDLRFSSHSWTVSPVNLKSALSLMVDLGQLDDTYPIAADTLFSRDPVLIGLSVFGDIVPSWEIPSGTLQSISVDAPPNPPSTSTQVKASKTGMINDAAWVMEIRRVSLTEAVEGFKRMAKAGGYRTIASAAARKQGYYVYQRGRMMEFWNELRDAMRTINTDIKSGKGEDSKKRMADKAAGPEQPSKKSKL